VIREKALDLIEKQWAEVKEKIRKMLDMEKIIISSNIAEAQGKSKAKLAVEENYQLCMKFQKKYNSTLEAVRLLQTRERTGQD
jgi:hypothetical protein